MNLHARVRRLRGKASDHECTSCAEDGIVERANEWAQIHGTDGKDIWADYVAMCHSCHRTYDMTKETRAALSRAWTPERKAAAAVRMKRLNDEGKAGPPSWNKTSKVIE